MKILSKRIECELPPAPGNPRNSEGSFLALKDGRLAFVYSRYAGTSSDDGAYAELALITCRDGVWSEPRILTRPDPGKGETNHMSVSLLRLQDGSIGLFFLIKYGDVISEVHLRRSTDELETLLPEDTLCVSDRVRNYYVLNNDRAVMTSDGGIVLPVAIHQSTLGFHDVWEADSRALAAFWRSDDGGRSWRQMNFPLALPANPRSMTGLQEPGVVELPGGALYAYFRTDLGVQYDAVSLDGGGSWFGPRPSAFWSARSALQIRRNPYSGFYYAVWNPVPETPFRYLGGEAPRAWTDGRTPLVIAESEDGVRFGTPCVVEDDPKAGFCYPAIHFDSASRIRLSYCCGGVAPEELDCLSRTRITALEIEH